MHDFILSYPPINILNIPPTILPIIDKMDTIKSYLFIILFVPSLFKTLLQWSTSASSIKKDKE